MKATSYESHCKGTYVFPGYSFNKNISSLVIPYCRAPAICEHTGKIPTPQGKSWQQQKLTPVWAVWAAEQPAENRNEPPINCSNDSQHKAGKAKLLPS